MFDRVSLRSVLLVDAVVSGAVGVLFLLGAGVLDGALDIPEAFLRGVGIALLPWCALLFLVARRAVISRAAVRFVIAVNLAWVAASILLPFTGWVEPNALGVAFILVQALAVCVFGLLQIAKLTEAAPTPVAQGKHGFQV